MEAKTTEWRPGPTVCRCCLTEGCYKDISTEYFWMGKREVYSEMLSETFDLNIAYSQSGGPNSNSRLICEPCISRLRDATDFKRQVLECERSFMQYLDPVGSGDIGVNLELDKEVKIERVKDEKTTIDDDDDDFVPPEFGDGDEDDDDLDDQPLTKLASKIPKKESVDVLDLLDNAKITEKRKSSSKSKSSPAKKTKLKKEVASCSKVKPEPRKKKESSKEVQATSKWSMTLPERKNAAYLLQYTTVTPFTYMIFPSGYKCLYCGERFTEVQNVLSHTRRHDVFDHKIILKDILKKGKKKIKVDISLLKCRICDEKFFNLETIRDHLTDVHEKVFMNAGNGMFAFSLEEMDGILTCHICSSTFHSFFLLNKHMSVHFSNAVCESCGKGFLSYHRLITHIKSHRNGTYPCKSCKKVFPSITKLKYHTGKYHGNVGRSKFAKCQKCAARFEHHYEKIKHLQEMHGLSLIFKCEICNMEFQSRQTMNLHIVKIHGQSILCRFCEQSFSDRYHLRKHILTHSESQNCQCPVCKKLYKSEKNLKYHMKCAHGPEWNYLCRICWTGFSIKDELKIHKISHS